MSIDPAYMAAESLQKDLTEIAKGIEKKHRVASVIIMVTYQDGERCRSINGRAGNYYASYGAVRDWIIYEGAAESEKARQAVIRQQSGTDNEEETDEFR